MKFLIAHGSFVPHDAIGNDIAGMMSSLSRFGQVEIYSIHNYTKIPSITYTEALSFISDPKNILIYHHSIYWPEGENLLKKSKCKIVFKYHNVTPPSFFESYCTSSKKNSDLGQQQTYRLAQNFSEHLWLTDSQFNQTDLNLVKRKMTIPPFHNIHTWNDFNPNNNSAEKSLRKEIKLIFVGRLAPNKAQHRLIQMLHAAKITLSQPMSLYLIGKSYTPKYLSFLKELTKQLEMDDCVHFVNEVNNKDLYFHYTTADAFVSMSQHEGFCVPIIEAQFLQTPIIALDIPAVRETIGSSDFLIKDNFFEFTEALVRLISNKKLRDENLQKGKLNYMARFNRPKIEELFIKTLSSEGILQ